MKTQLTTEQSKHLFDLGVPREKASEFEPFDRQDDGEFIFTLTDFLDILPKEIRVENKEYALIIEFNRLYAFAYYYGGNTPSLGRKRRKELIDALYELVVWCIENGHLKF